jgi:hypothetical protein
MSPTLSRRCWKSWRERAGPAATLNDAERLPAARTRGRLVDINLKGRWRTGSSNASTIATLAS